jgi:hypothetical protein
MTASPGSSYSKRVHELKTWPEFFESVINGQKRFEVRKDDRNFQVGDTVVLREFNPVMECYSDRESRWLVGYILRGPQFGIEAGYAVLQLCDSLRHAEKSNV